MATLEIVLPDGKTVEVVVPPGQEETLDQNDPKSNEVPPHWNGVTREYANRPGSTTVNGNSGGVQEGTIPNLGTVARVADLGVLTGGEKNGKATVEEEGTRREVPVSPGGTGAVCPMRGKPKPKYMRIQNLLDGKQYTDTLHNEAYTETPCNEQRCLGSIVNPTKGEKRDKDELLLQAEDLIRQYYTHIKRADTSDHKKRWAEIETSIGEKGTYDLTEAELLFGAKTAWRNAPRCIGRIQWTKLQLFDARNATTTRDMFHAICNFLRYTTNGGNIRLAILVFPHQTDPKHDFRIWNSLLIRYACYKQPDGSLIGDPASLEFTEECQKLGWKGSGGAWDVLPLVLQASGGEPEIYDIPRDLILEVEITHPTYEWFAELGLRWYALPAVSGMLFDVGGLKFPCSPFNGWFMVTEIGTRNLCDENRLNMCEPVAKRMGLDTSTHTSLWKDSAALAVNIAVMYSYQKAKVTITDHHTMSESFMKHLENEQRLRGGCPADWVWVVPPTSGSLTPLFHQEMISYKLKPSYEYQRDAWKDYEERNREKGGGKRFTLKKVSTAVMFLTKLMGKALAKRTKATILYATETGRSETFAKRLRDIFSRAFNAKVMCMEDYNPTHLEHESLLLVVTSTFGNGDSPENGETFKRFLVELKSGHLGTEDKFNEFAADGWMTPPSRASEPLENVRYSVFGLGSTAYPNFAAFGRAVDSLIGDMCGKRILVMGEGDELGGQEESFRKWAKEVFLAACKTFCVDKDVYMDVENEALQPSALGWEPDKSRLVPVKSSASTALSEGLAKLHRKTVLPCLLISRTNLQSEESTRSTIRLRMDTQGASELLYQPGDHVAICPANEEELVDAVLNRVDSKNRPNDAVALEVLRHRSTQRGLIEVWNTSTRLPPCSVRHALTYYLDITTAPSPDFLRLLGQQATDPGEQQELLLLGEGGDAYDNWRFQNSLTLVEVLGEFPSVKLSAEFLLQEAPLLKPRYYSISSSAQMYPGEIHITVAVVIWKNRSTRSPPHNGVCSSWLNRLKEGEEFPAFIRRSPLFHLPERKELPCILVGSGTGIAPFRSFWQQRQIDSQFTTGGEEKLLGDIHVFFGCRHPGLDDIYADERKEAVQNGALKEVHVAFSRKEDTPKRYVQNVLYEHAQKVFNIIDKEMGHFYVCGDVYMAEDVQKNLEKIICEMGEMNIEKAEEYVREMKNQRRYHEDIFDITLKKSQISSNDRKQSRRQSRIRVSRRSLRMASPEPALEEPKEETEIREAASG